jgi:hypothetical protein
MGSLNEMIKENPNPKVRTLEQKIKNHLLKLESSISLIFEQE